ncbi:FoF1 ATP synthase subunit gamma [Labrenzia sp. 011]|uniref:F0F1 ATP synthase subunit gamma n=1 Tax=Labrenzia sp. 011 TaxID=2171494 RepID=UPI000D51F2B8|nr:FoF1 ATP synthase subunit gamma [Labrenzia sp. 011]PVB59407.1 ATPase [Labrenzia sp. 011]
MNRPEEIQERIANIHEIDSVVSTLRALATAHQMEARTHLDAIRTHEATVAGALSTALPLGDPGGQEDTRDGPALAIVVGAAQGFSGSFGDRMAETCLALAAEGRALMVVGSRTRGTLEEHGVSPVWWTDMAPHAAEVPRLANRLMDTLFERFAETPGMTLDIVFGDPATPDRAPVRRTLFPFDFSRFPAAPGTPPLTTLSAENLIGALVEEYVFTEVCEALMLGFSAENAARAAAMSRAQSNVKRIAADLKGAFQRARQEQMTTEIIELSTVAAQDRV